ncbi:MAG: WYL domain-containing protein [Candidatus Nanopelagicales bacterium]|nr:WYL domain-containing protein [Candidatus Nanopelagicales bacterium]
MSTDLVPAVVHVLEQHGPIALRDLAALVGEAPHEVRRQLAAFNEVDLPDLQLDPLFVVEPAGGSPDEGPEPAPADDDVVRFWSTMRGQDLGLTHTDAATLGPLLAAADQLRSLEPDNLDLAAAVDTLRATLMRATAGRAAYRSRLAAVLQRAAQQRRAVRIAYASAWTPRVGERVIHPYRVVSTSRGYEVDAGPLDEQRRPRTFLLSGISQLRVLDEHFTVPEGAAAAMERNRELTPVSGVARHRRMWAVRHWAERVDQGPADAEDVTFTAWVLPPVAERVAVMCLVAGAGTDLDDAALDAAVRQRARALLEHHGLG